MFRYGLSLMMLVLALGMAACAAEPSPSASERPSVEASGAGEPVGEAQPTESAAPDAPGPGTPAADPETTALGISPEDIGLDAASLNYAWTATVIRESAYDASRPPGPVGLPEHLLVRFERGTTDEQSPDGDPLMYIIPVNAYLRLWDEAGDGSVSAGIETIEQLSFMLPSPPPSSGLPALPPEAVGAGPNDLAVQIGRATASSQLNLQSSTQTGYRFVGRWAQDALPVTNGGLRYSYQGFTNDGRYLVAFWAPVTNSSLPDGAESVSEDELSEVSSDLQKYLATAAEALNAHEPEAWEPSLTDLDALIASLSISGMPIAGIHDRIWHWTEGPVQPGGAEIVKVEDPQMYTATYGSNGTLAYVADCNSGSMAYELQSGGMAGSMLAQPGAMTLAECGPDSLYQGFSNSLMAAQDYRVRAGGDRLELVLPAGGGSLLFSDAGGVALVSAGR